MPFSLDLPVTLRRAGWKVKIRDKERLEDPHVTILFKTKAWRLNLRTRKFLDQPWTWREIDPGVREAVEGSWDRLCAEWNSMYPNDPVGGRE
jgi:hypothetical protein